MKTLQVLSEKKNFSARARTHHAYRISCDETAKLHERVQEVIQSNTVLES